MNAPLHGRDEYLTKRVETFSDIVIGFGLAQLALTLVIPNHISDLWTNLWWFFSYFWSFVIVAWIWGSHNRVFRHYFIPAAVPMILNFVILFSVGLLVYTLQLTSHFTTRVDDLRAIYTMYFGLIAVVSAAFAGIFWWTLPRRRAELDDRTYLDGRKALVRWTMTALVLPVALVACIPAGFAVFFTVVPLSVVIAGVASGRMGRAMERAATQGPVAAAKS